MNRLTREADELIRKVVARYNTLYSPAGKISQIELDLMLDELRLLYEKFKSLGLLNLQGLNQESHKIVVSPEQSETKAVKEEIPASAPAYQPEQEQEPEPESSFYPQESTEIKPAPEAAKYESPVSQPLYENSEWVAPETQKNIHEDSHHTLADKFKTEQKSLSDVIAGSAKDNSLGSRMQHQPIEDLKSVIGLAEKFNFINELFGGDPLAYERAIGQLNGATRLGEAEAYLGTLRLNYKWPANSVEAVKLGEIIQRKFAAVNE